MFPCVPALTRAPACLPSCVSPSLAGSVVARRVAFARAELEGTAAAGKKWVCRLCAGLDYQPTTFRFRCEMTCDWDVCDICVSKRVGVKKVVQLVRKIGQPIGIEFSGTVVMGLLDGSVAEAYWMGVRVPSRSTLPRWG